MCTYTQSTHKALVWRVLYSFTTHLTRTLGFPGCPFVGLRPTCLDGLALPDSHVHLASTDVLYLFTPCLGTQLRVKPPASVVVPVPSFPRAEQQELVLMHKFPHLGFHGTQPFISHPPLSSSAPASPAPASPFSAVPLLLWRLRAPTFPFAPSFRSCLRRPRHADACRCICFATAPRLVARWLSFAPSR